MNMPDTTAHDDLVDVDLGDLDFDAEEKKKPKMRKHKELATDKKRQRKDDVNADLDAADLFGDGDGGDDGTAEPSAGQSAQGGTIEPCDNWQIVEDDATTIAQGQSQLTLDEWLAFFDQEHFVSFHGQHFVVYREIFIDDRASLARLTDTAFKKFHANKVVLDPTPRDTPKYIPVAPVWLQRTSKRYEQLVFDPSGQHDPRNYNMWRGFGVDPVPFDHDNIRLITDDLIGEALCGGDTVSKEYVLNWLAHGVQNPAIKPGVALVLRGAQGTGKGTLGRLMLTIWGGHGLTVAHSKHLTGNFNSHLRNTVFVFSDEAQFVGDAQGNQALKALITEDYGVFEAKGIDADLRKNFLKVLMATNSEWVVNVGPDARRYFVLDVSDCKRVDPKNPVNRPFWGEINAYINSRGAAEFLDYLLKRDLTDFVPAIFPQTEALARQRAMSLPPVHEYVLHCLEKGTMADIKWNGEGLSIATGDLYEGLLEHCKKRQVRTQDLSSARVGSELKKLGIEKSRRRAGAERMYHYVFPPRVEFAQKVKEVCGLPDAYLSELEDMADDDEPLDPGKTGNVHARRHGAVTDVSEVDLSGVSFD